MNIFSCFNLSKSFNDKQLFDQVSFGMDEGERGGIIGKNGAGKTTLMRIIAGLETPDSGNVAFNKEMRFEYLEQLPRFEKHESVLQTVMSCKPQTHALLIEHSALCRRMEHGEHTKEIELRVNELSALIDEADGWRLETDAKIYLQKLGIAHFDGDVATLSGGQRKRVALARALLSNPDLLILDEPTNHLDADSVQWLQDRLQNSTKALLLVTHDRYFLDAVTNRIIEIDRGKLFTYGGNFEYYLEKKEALVTAQEAAAEHTRNKLRTELAWLQRGAKARRTKQKSRIDWIAKIQAEPKSVEQKNIKIELGNSFLGSKVIDAINISKSIAGKVLFKNFTYLATPGERIGIIGANGSGKSTLLNVLTGRIPPDSGSVKIGETVRIGYFDQESLTLNDAQSLLGTLREVAEYIDVGVGRDRYLSAKDLLNRFLFEPKQHGALVGSLSGGERRRLALLRVLMANPNVLVLDEPTNDFDIGTLSALEEYLQNFLGCLITVSHDRSFLDRTVDAIYAFESNGEIKQYPGNYSAYLEKKEAGETDRKAEIKAEKASAERSKPSEKKKIPFKIQKELDRMEAEIATLESKKSAIEEFLGSGLGNYQEMAKKGAELREIEEKIEEITLEWLELGESASA